MAVWMLSAHDDLVFFSPSTAQTVLGQPLHSWTELDFPVCDNSTFDLGCVSMPELPGGSSTELISPVVPNEPQVLMPTEQLESEPSTAQTMQVQPLLSPSDVALTVCDDPVTPEVEETGQSDSQINLPSPPIPPTFHSTSLARQVIELVEAEFHTEEMGLLQPPQSHFDTDFPVFDSSEPGFHYAFWPDTDI